MIVCVVFSSCRLKDSGEEGGFRIAQSDEINAGSEAKEDNGLVHLDVLILHGPDFSVYLGSGPMQKRCLSPRRKRLPWLRAGLAETRSSMSFCARIVKVGCGAMIVVTP